jgi:hypothetical protein
MRLVETTRPQVLPHKVFPNALEDMQALYGGRITDGENQTTGKPQSTLKSDDGLVMALTHGRRPKETLVGFERLHYREGAQRWTALHAYRGHAGPRKAEFGYLDTERRDLVAHEEWISRRRLYDATIEQKDFFTTCAEREDGGYTVFSARGATLPAAARLMAKEYTEFFARNENEDPDIIIAHALGVRSLDHLDMLWSDAMAEPTPLAAGRLVLGELTLEGVGNV